jgi:hypothetical protein
MTRLLRILTSVATVLSLVLCAVAMAAWVRSYLANDLVSWTQETPRLLIIDTYRGGIAAEISTWRSGPTLPTGARYDHSVPQDYAEAVGSPRTWFNKFGFALHYSEQGGFANQRGACPYWFIVLLTAILPAARLARWRRRRARRLRMSPGLCRHCGYDCRATSERCPECGTPAAAG